MFYDKMNVTFNLATFGDGTVFTVLKGPSFTFSAIVKVTTEKV